MLLFNFLINILVLPYYENYLNNFYNISVIPKNTQKTTIKSRRLAQTQIHNPHYHNDPELKEIIDKMNKEAIEKYQQSHDPYKQLKEVVEKNGAKYTGRNDAEPMSTLEKELLETYEEMYGNKSDMLKSGMSPNVDEQSSICECTNTNNTKLATTKGRDKYLKHLKQRCKCGIAFCSVGSALLTSIGTAAAKGAAISTAGAGSKNCIYAMSIFHMLNHKSMTLAMKSLGTVGCAADYASGASSASAIFHPCGITALVLLILAVVLIILYIWLYRRRKRSWKHECKKHLCK
ncbi:stevor [Plasmodium falciparum HB3]|uniref:Stevor n=1 Tax=Plasmodium falciparum (isolate HB3) TaxID=137071 RepID=A0A0L7KG33_PLAFX|nr:stevor [Plasmodium falciparum HB3]